MELKPVFDVVRKLLGRGMRQSEVDEINAALKPLNRQLSEGINTQKLNLSQRGVDFIKVFEGCARIRKDGRIEAYPDPGTGGDPWTIGWGTTGRDVVPGLVWTQVQCDARFERELQRYVREVTSAIGDAPTTQGQFEALVSFHYNTGAIRKATLTRLHKAGDHAGAAAEFGKWVNAGGKRLSGLVRRRGEEAALYSRTSNA